MPRLLRTLCFAVCLVLASPLGAQEAAPPPLKLPVPESVFKETQALWYGLYMEGAKMGWALDRSSPGEWNGKPCVIVESQMSMDIKAMGNSMKMNYSVRKYFSAQAPNRLIAFEETQRLNNQERVLSLRHTDGNNYTGVVKEALRARNVSVQDVDYFLWNVTSSAEWAKDPARKPGDTIAMAEFTAEHMKMTRQTGTILKAAEWAGPGGKAPVWEIKLEQVEDAIQFIARISRADGNMVNAHFGPSIEARLEPQKIAQASPESGAPDLFTAFQIPVDRPLVDSPKLTELLVEITAPTGRPLPKLPNTSNQIVEKVSEDRVVLRISPGKFPPQAASESDRVAALKSTPRYPIEEDSIQELSKKAVADAKTDREKVEKLLAFTDSYIRDSMTTEPLTVMDLIKNRKGDCSAHSLLFVALARAAGIPARQAGGWMYMGNTYKAFGGHAWNEVILDGAWVPVDPLWRQFPLDAGHIQQTSSEQIGSMIDGMVPGLKARVISFGTK